MVRGAQAIVRAGALWIAAVLLLALAPAASAQTMVVQPDGKILLAGATPLFSGYLARLLPSGEPDPSFGVDGIVVDHRLDGLKALALEPDGSILALDRECCLARYTPDGQLDKSFGTDGYVSLWVITDPTDLLVLPDGRILVGGDQNHKLLAPEALLDLLSADGDKQEWVSSARFGTSLTSILANPDGSVLMLAGGAENGRKSLLTRFVPGSTPSYGEGYSSIGVPRPEPGYDRSFAGGAGITSLVWPVERPPDFGGRALATVPGSIYVGGAPGTRLALVRLDDEGIVDPSFGSDGFATVGSGSRRLGVASSLAVANDGDILLFGDFRPRGSSRWCGTCRTPVLARFSPSGQRDISFGLGGTARMPGVSGPTHGDEARDLELLGSGKILATAAPEESASRMLLSRFATDGGVDQGFGSGGVLRFEPCRGSEAGQRKNGCLPSAAATFRVRRAPGGRLSLRLKVSPRDDWWAIDSLRVQLPSSLTLRPRQFRRATFSYRDSGQQRWRQPAKARNGALVFHRTRGMEPGPILLTVPPGVLRVVGPLPAGLTLHIRVGFSQGYRASTGVQTLLVAENYQQTG